MLLLLLSLLPAVHTTGPPTLLEKSISGCPSEGYFFERQLQPGIEPAPCYLCLCKSDEQAICTLRDDERCGKTDISHRTDVEETMARRRRKKHRRRPRRSPGLMEIFFQDKKKDQMLTSMRETNSENCTPKASKSIGCPPKNWCTGCLVCDCNDGGKWECHVMSFCEDKTPRPIFNNIKKANLKKSVATENKIKKRISTTSVPAKKTHKRSIIREKKNKNSSIAPTQKNMSTTRKNIFKKKLEKTTLKPAMPLISVKTKMSFAHKNNSREPIVIRKYISTMSPIDSPELLKYKNDSRKLAQILYQQYEASQKENKYVKREIITHAFTKEKKANNGPELYYGTANSINMGEKIFSKKLTTKLKLKTNAVGRKPINVKDHKDWNTKNKTLKQKRKKKSSNNFYDIQKELMESGADNRIKRKQKKANRDHRAYYERKEKLKLIALASRRNKRDVSVMMEDSNSTTAKNKIVNTTSFNIDQVSETPAELFTNNDKIASSLNNYKYDIDNIVTQNYSGNEIFNNDKGDETKLNDVTTVYGRDIESKNVTIMDTVNYTDTRDTNTKDSKQPKNTLHTLINVVNLNNMNKQTEELYLNNNYSVDTTIAMIKNTEDTTTENPKQPNNTLHTLNNVVDSNEIINQTEDLYSKNNHSVDTTTAIDFNLNGTGLSDRKIALKENSEYANITYVNKFAFELSKNEKPHFNNTENNKIMYQFSNSSNTNANTIKKVYNKDKDTIITVLNRSKLKKLVKTNEPKGINNTFTASLQSGPINKNLPINHKYRSKNRLVAIKYLKSIYRKLLSNNNNQTRFNNNAVMESLCDTFGPCKISSKSVKAVNAKITELVSETKKALNVIKSIKSSLQLIDGGNINTGNVTEEVKFKNYVIKLNAILKDNYGTSQAEHEITQIKNIKSNIKVFTNSISKFAFILNDILKIIRLDKIKYNNRKKHKIILKKAFKPKIDSKLLHTLKTLLKKFNLLQNTFMRNIYQILSDLELQNNLNIVAVDKSKNNEENYHYKIKKYLNKINYNLAKLKDFALKKGTNERRKRYATNDDDAVEYLLTLIEYLLRLNNPINSPPVADGIDLLIDAIRRAPDIKPIMKTVIQEKSTVPNYSVKELSKSNSESGDENVSHLNNESDILNDNSSLEKWYNDTDTLPSNFGNKPVEYKVTTPYVSRNMFTEATKHVDVEDLVFNGNKLQNVYIATFSPYENTEDYFEKEEVTSKRPKKPSKIKTPAVNNPVDKTFILMNTTNTKTEINIPKVTTSPAKTHFDLLNEEYEKRLKVQIPNDQPIKMKRKKTKRPNNKSKINSKSDVSSITTEIDEEKTRKKVITEEAMLKKHLFNVIDDDLFKLTGDESVSKDFSSLDANNERITNYFTY